MDQYTLDRLSIEMIWVWQTVFTILHDGLKRIKPRLSPFEFLLLESIADERAFGTEMKTLREQLKLSCDQATKLVGKLRKPGLVDVTRGGKSRRTKAVTATKLGSRFRRQIEKRLNDQLRTMLEKEDPARLDEILPALDSLCRLLPPTRVGRTGLELQ